MDRTRDRWRAHDYDRDFRGNPGFDQRRSQREDFREYGGDYEYDQGYRSSGTYRRPYGSAYGGGAYGSGYGGYGRRDRDTDRDWMDKTGDEIASWFGDDDAERRRDWDRRRDRDRNRGDYRTHRGRGPNPVFSEDEDLRDKICHRMRDDDDLDASDIHIHVRDNEAILEGVVDDEEERRHAQRCAQSVRGIRFVRNRLRTREDRRGYGGSDHRREQYGRDLYDRDTAVQGYADRRERMGSRVW